MLELNNNSCPLANLRIYLDKGLENAKLLRNAVKADPSCNTCMNQFAISDEIKLNFGSTDLVS